MWIVKFGLLGTVYGVQLQMDVEFGWCGHAIIAFDSGIAAFKERLALLFAMSAGVCAGSIACCFPSTSSTTVCRYLFSLCSLSVQTAFHIPMWKGLGSGLEGSTKYTVAVKEFGVRPRNIDLQGCVRCARLLVTASWCKMNSVSAN